VWCRPQTTTKTTGRTKDAVFHYKQKIVKSFIMTTVVHNYNDQISYNNAMTTNFSSLESEDGHLALLLAPHPAKSLQQY
jgi:hypothetical protein